MVSIAVYCVVTMAAELLAETGILIGYDEYAASAAKLIKYDDDSHQTIRGIPVYDCMHLGVIEEWAEIFGSDVASTEETFGYSRVDALRGGRSYVDLFRGTTESEAQITLHLHEFGDSLWYVTNYLAYFGISLEETMRDTDYAFEYSQPYDSEMLEKDEGLYTYPSELVAFIDGGRNLLSHMGAILNRSDSASALDPVSAHTLKQLGRQYIESMAALTGAVFGVSLGEIMTANLEKISGRWKNGTINGNGDSR